MKGNERAESTTLKIRLSLGNVRAYSRDTRAHLGAMAARTRRFARRGTKRVTTAGRLIVSLPRRTTLYASAKFLNVHAKRVKARREAEESGGRGGELRGTKFTMQ